MLRGGGTSDPRLVLGSYASEVVCLNKAIEWAGSLEVTIKTTRSTPVANINVSLLAH